MKRNLTRSKAVGLQKAAYNHLIIFTVFLVQPEQLKLTCIKQHTCSTEQ